MLQKRLWPLALIATLLGCRPSTTSLDSTVGEKVGDGAKTTADIAPSRAVEFSFHVYEYYQKYQRCPTSTADVDSDGRKSYWREPYGREWQFLCAPNGAAVLSLGPDGIRSLDDVAGAYITDSTKE